MRQDFGPQQTSPNGNSILMFNVLRGSLYRNTEIFGVMDPYIAIDVNGKRKFRTATAKNAGFQPEWNQTFEIPVTSQSDVLTISCNDKDLIYDDLIGKRMFTLDYFTNNLDVKTECISVFAHGKKAADIWI